MLTLPTVLNSNYNFLGPLEDLVAGNLTKHDDGFFAQLFIPVRNNSGLPWIKGTKSALLAEALRDIDNLGATAVNICELK